MSHAQPPEDRFCAWVDGTMSPAEQAQFEAELHADPSLRAALAQYQHTIASLQAAYRAVPPAADWQRKARAIAARRKQDWRAWRWLAGVAALAMVSVVWWWPSGPAKVPELGAVFERAAAAPPSEPAGAWHADVPWEFVGDPAEVRAWLATLESLAKRYGARVVLQPEVLARGRTADKSNTTRVRVLVLPAAPAKR